MKEMYFPAWQMSIRMKGQLCNSCRLLAVRRKRVLENITRLECAIHLCSVSQISSRYPGCATIDDRLHCVSNPACTSFAEQLRLYHSFSVPTVLSGTCISPPRGRATNGTRGFYTQSKARGFSPGPALYEESTRQRSNRSFLVCVKPPACIR
jgi:hypothetical protein